MYYDIMDSIIGKLGLLVDKNFSVKKILFEKDLDELNLGLYEQQAEKLSELKKQLELYFQGKSRDFNLKLDPDGTEFQKKVWKELLKIPYGEKTSYLGLARNIGQIKAVRAVGAANGKNPIPIIIPCHRVIGSNGKLTGYAGGLEVKDKLLSLEESIIFEKGLVK